MELQRATTRIRTATRGVRLAAVLSLGLAAAVLIPAGSAAAADDVPPATRFAPGSPATLIAQDIARANWGTDACGGQVSVEWGADAANINARSYWANPLSSYDNPDLNTQCRVVFNTAMAFTWAKFCTVLVHEYGHLTGHPHSADGPDVMSPIYRAPLPACTTADPSAPPAAVPAPASVAPVSAPAASSTAIEAPARRAVRTTRVAVRVRGGAKLRAPAHAASTSFSNENAEPLPWAPFAADVH